MDSLDYELFKGKGFKDLCQDIYQNQVSRKDQIEIFIQDLRPLVKTTTDAMIIVPLIKGYMDTGNTNDDHLVKLASIIQKLITAQASSNDSEGGMGLTEEEKKNIMAEIATIKSDEKNNLQPELELLEKQTASIITRKT